MWLSSQELSRSWQPRLVLSLLSEALHTLPKSQQNALEGGERTEELRLQFWPVNTDLGLGSGWGSLSASSSELSSAATGLEQAAPL